MSPWYLYFPFSPSIFYSLNMFESNIYPARDSNIQVLSRPRIFPAEVPIDTYAVPLGAPEVPVAVWNLRINKWCTMKHSIMKMDENGWTWWNMNIWFIEPSNRWGLNYIFTNEYSIFGLFQAKAYPFLWKMMINHWIFGVPLDVHCYFFGMWNQGFRLNWPIYQSGAFPLKNVL